MSLIQTILVALIPVAFIGWRLRRLVGVLRGGGATWKKIALALLIGFGVLARVSRLIGTSRADASPVATSREPADSKAANPVPVGRAPEVVKLIAAGKVALARCDTATADSAFQRLAGIGIDMMKADTLAGDPLFFQGVALAGLRDSANASVLVTEAARLDRQQHVPENPEHAAMMRQVTALAGKRC